MFRVLVFDKPSEISGAARPDAFDGETQTTSSSANREPSYQRQNAETEAKGPTDCEEKQGSIQAVQGWLQKMEMRCLFVFNGQKEPSHAACPDSYWRKTLQMQ